MPPWLSIKSFISPYSNRRTTNMEGPRRTVPVFLLILYRQKNILPGFVSGSGLILTDFVKEAWRSRKEWP
jgi:hypothetical protein